MNAEEILNILTSLGNPKDVKYERSYLKSNI